MTESSKLLRVGLDRSVVGDSGWPQDVSVVAISASVLHLEGIQAPLCDRNVLPLRCCRLLQLAFNPVRSIEEYRGDDMQVDFVGQVCTLKPSGNVVANSVPGAYAVVQVE